MRPSPSPSITDLYLAFRQAKTALYFERRGVGLLDLAEYEDNLAENLRALQDKLANGQWFDKISIGHAWIVPKRHRVPDGSADETVRIGTSKISSRAIDVQMRLNPNPEFAIVEIIYLWRFGGFLDALLLKEEVVGHRLDLRRHQIVPHRRWVFEYWPRQYQEYQTAPLRIAKKYLKKNKRVSIISGDLASFYDTINPDFMLTDSLISGLARRGASLSDIEDYRIATKSLLKAYEQFRADASRSAALSINVGVPIGALTSRIIANLSLDSLDRHIISQSGILSYRRYVDDFAIVTDDANFDLDTVRTLQRYLPLLVQDSDVLLFDVDALSRSGSEFQLQRSKVRVHHLAGIAGVDFIEAVGSDFSKAVSEWRAFVDSSTLSGNGAAHLIRVGVAKGSPLRVLRDADRARLERFALSTGMRSLERVSSLIEHHEAKKLVRDSLERVGRVLDAEDDWISDLGVSTRLLKLAISAGDWVSAGELLDRMDRVWGTTEALKAEAPKLYYRGREIPQGAASWRLLRNYLHEQRLEAISSALPIDFNIDAIESMIPNGLIWKTKRFRANALKRRAKKLARSDLRSRDREDDYRSIGQEANADRSWMKEDLHGDPELATRMKLIDEFLARCNELGDSPWISSPARLFLCTRPPSYFDIARRWLYRVESDGFEEGIFQKLLSIVNAVRGTEYRDAVGKVIDRGTISIDSSTTTAQMNGKMHPEEPRIILGNLLVENNAWYGAATRVPGSPNGEPVLSRTRLQGLIDVLDKATRAACKKSAMLVLPELSVPRQWFRTVSNHIVRDSRFGLVVGLEYLHSKIHPYVSNQVFAVLPGPFRSVATWPWTKRLPAHEEGKLLAGLKTPVSFRPVSQDPRKNMRRTVVHSDWGKFSVLICSELFEARRVADLLGRVNFVVCPAWNTDTASYDHLIQSVGFKLHSVIAIANNALYSDCRAWAPRAVRWERDLCRLIERGVDDVVYVDIPLASLAAFHGGDKQVKDRYLVLRKALERQDLVAAHSELERLAGQLPGAWRPLPPDWPRNT